MSLANSLSASLSHACMCINDLTHFINCCTCNVVNMNSLLPPLHTVHSPTVSITSSPSNSTLGKNLSVTCTSTNQYRSEINSILITTHIVWQLLYISGGDIINDTFEAVNVLNLSTSMFYSELVYSPLLTAINFTCMSYLSFPSERVSNSEVAEQNRGILPQGINMKTNSVDCVH